MSPPSAGPALAIEMAPQRSASEPPKARPLPEPRLPSLAPPPVPPEATVEELQGRLSSHPFWNNRLLQACRRGLLTREDYAGIFSQYALVTRSAPRFLHALLAQCDSEPWSAKLTQALWEEHAAQPPEQQPAALFRTFLRNGLGVDLESIHFHDFTRYFVRECLDWCLRSPPHEACAFLAFGMEALLPRLYSVFVDGLQQAGVAERHLAFFHRKMQGDTRRVNLLAEMVRAHTGEPGWFDACTRAMERALELQGNFLNGLFESARYRRLAPLMERIQARLPLVPEEPDPRTLHLGDLSNVVPFFRQTHEPRSIDFSVDRVPFPGEVLETSVVQVAPGRRSEPREHAHEVLLVVLSGTGRVHVRGTAVLVKPGDAVFIPRWALHQAQSTGPEPLVLLTVTDHGLTRHAHEDEVLRAAHLKRATGVDL
ncbi:cupin domain-containing protein [Hyalangium versicolor]|uniref:cupin domain-containing protein n=1 Tax=Hyalangium versicolor TaxID=2861190 RepID=UPI001CCE1245|nr:cupin domain-containing protein [Hyalangium versicolor]